MVYTDLYACLNLDTSCDRSDVQKAFKALSRQFHPDKQAASEDTFRQIRQAHDVLVDRVLRMVYDDSGLAAVDLVWRSHNKTEDPSKPQARDLYVELQQAPDQEEALKILHQALDQFQFTQSVSRQSPWDATVTLPHAYHINALEDTTPSVHYETKRYMSSQVATTLRCGGTKSSNGLFESHTQCGLAWHDPSFGPVGTIDWDNDGVVKVQSSRHLESGSNFMVTLAGKPLERATWSYTLVASRALQWSEKTPRLQASWQFAMGLTGQLQFWRFDLRQMMEYPRWLVRIGLDAPLTLQWELPHWLISYTVPWIPSVMQGRVQYKADHWKLSLLKRNFWKVVWEGSWRDWDVRIPISLHPYTEATIVGTVLSCMVAEFLEETFLKEDDTKEQTKQKELPILQKAPPPFLEFVPVVAEKKRQYETDRDGLVILEARWNDSERSLTDLLQFWVVDGYLETPMERLHWWTTTTDDDAQPESWWNMLQSWWNEPPKHSDVCYVRYVYQDSVYEYSTTDSHLVLPNSGATRLGARDRVR